MVGKYILKRLLIGVLTVYIIITGAFFLIRSVPGDPVTIWLGDYMTPELKNQLIRSWGLDKPFYQQYLIFLGKIVQGDLGTSLRSNMPVLDLIKRIYPFTIRLMIGGVILGALLGIIFGIFAAARQNSVLDLAAMVNSFIYISMPSFLLALILLYIFSIKLGWFPMIGGETPNRYSTYLPYLVLPWFCLGLRSTGMISRMVRSTMLDVLSADYIRTARSKGLSERFVLYKHALRNTLTSVVSLIGSELIVMLGGTVIVEVVFSRPGLGMLYFTAVSSRDYPLMQGCILTIAAMVICVNLIIDISYAIIDPRIREVYLSR